MQDDYSNGVLCWNRLRVHRDEAKQAQLYLMCKRTAKSKGVGRARYLFGNIFCSSLL